MASKRPGRAGGEGPACLSPWRNGGGCIVRNPGSSGSPGQEGGSSLFLGLNQISSVCAWGFRRPWGIKSRAGPPGPHRPEGQHPPTSWERPAWCWCLLYTYDHLFLIQRRAVLSRGLWEHREGGSVLAAMANKGSNGSLSSPAAPGLASRIHAISRVFV